jgi:hypothetical protein
MVIGMHFPLRFYLSNSYANGPNAIIAQISPKRASAGTPKVLNFPASQNGIRTLLSHATTGLEALFRECLIFRHLLCEMFNKQRYILYYDWAEGVLGSAGFLYTFRIIETGLYV